MYFIAVSLLAFQATVLIKFDLTWLESQNCGSMEEVARFNRNVKWSTDVLLIAFIWKIHRTMVRSVLIYGAESWTLRRSDFEREYETFRLSWSLSSVRSGVFCSLCACWHSASSALEINFLMIVRYISVHLIIIIMIKWRRTSRNNWNENATMDLDVRWRTGKAVA